jgi:hypothetical protein
MGVRTGPPHDFAIHHRCVGVQARCCIRDGLEPRRPIVAAAGEHADGALPYLKLNSVTIVFDLMQPSVAAGRLGHQRRLHGLNEVREGSALRAFKLACEPLRGTVLNVGVLTLGAG